MKLKLILTALALSDLIFKDNTTTLSKEQVEKLQAHFKDKVGQELALTDLAYDAEGYATFSQKSLESIEAMLEQHGTAEGASTNNDAAVEASLQSIANAQNASLQAQLNRLQTDLAAEQQRNAAAQATIESLGRVPEPTPAATQVSDFISKAIGFNSPDGFRFYNKAALMIAQEGNRAMASAIVSASVIEIDSLNNELGAHFRERYPEIQDFVIKTPSIDGIFPPFGTGIKDELVVTDIFTDEFLQPYNPKWAEKGGFEFKPEIIKVRDFKVDHRFNAEEIRNLITSWLAPMTKGTDPFQESFVAFLTKKMIEKIVEEKTMALIRGVYRVSPDGVAGPAIESINGLMKTIQTIRESFRIKPFALGKWNNSLKSENHIYRMIYRMYMMLPQQLRDSNPVMNVYTSTDGATYFNNYKNALGRNTDLEPANVEQVPDNVNVIGVPFYNSHVLIMTVPGLIRQFFREKGEDNRFHTQLEKRDTIVFMDGAAGIYPIKSGYTYENAKAQTFDNQIIFLSDEWDDYTYIKVDPNKTVLDATVHNAMMISQNTAAVTITAINNVRPGGTVFLLGQSEVGMESTLNTTSNIILTAAWKSTKGSKLVLVENAGKLLEIERYNVSESEISNAEMFGDDDETPTLSPVANLYLTATSGADVTITDLLEAIPGRRYTIRSSAGTIVTTIAANDRFTLAGASWVSSASSYITFHFSGTNNKFVEIERG